MPLLVSSFLSLYFLRNSTDIQVSFMFENLHSPANYFAFAFVTYCGYHIGKSFVDENFPFRAFLVASFVLFVMLSIGGQGWGGYSDGLDDYVDYVELSPEEVFVSENGGLFGRYWIYIICTYSGMLYAMPRISKN
ncbi:MAG: hypothetical protein R3C70_15615 [Geminicoccaceae bacterium]